MLDVVARSSAICEHWSEPPEHSSVRYLTVPSWYEHFGKLDTRGRLTTTHLRAGAEDPTCRCSLPVLCNLLVTMRSPRGLLSVPASVHVQDISADDLFFSTDIRPLFKYKTPKSQSYFLPENRPAWSSLPFLPFLLFFPRFTSSTRSHPTLLSK